MNFSDFLGLVLVVALASFVYVCTLAVWGSPGYGKRDTPRTIIGSTVGAVIALATIGLQQWALRALWDGGRALTSDGAHSQAPTTLPGAILEWTFANIPTLVLVAMLIGVGIRLMLDGDDRLDWRERQRAAESTRGRDESMRSTARPQSQA